MVLRRATRCKHTGFHDEIDERQSRNPSTPHKSPQIASGQLQSPSCLTIIVRHIKSVTGHKSDQSTESFYDRQSFDQQRNMSNTLSAFLDDCKATSADKENTTTGQQLIVQTRSPCTTAATASPASVLVQHNQVSVLNVAHGEQGHRSPPQVNFYSCTNVQIHNNFGSSV